jgi:delta-1-pyrroline-5-carboxylate synthetase
MATVHSMPYLRSAPSKIGLKYSRMSAGITGQSNRIILSGGLSALRNDRNTAPFIDAGVTQNAIHANRPAILRNLPPKRWMFGRGMHTNAAPPTLHRSLSSFLNRRNFGNFGHHMSSEAIENGNGNHVITLPNRVGKEGNGGTDILYRNQLKNAKRIVIKLGSAVITRADGNGLALGRLAAIVEEISELQNDGRECILITSGAVAFGKQKLAQEVMMSMSMRETIQQNNTKDEINALMKRSLKKPNAAVGQSGLQALYETMFRNYGILVGQVLVTKADFYNKETREQLFTTIDELLQLNIIPIINTNDAVSPPPTETEDVDGILGIKDNDSLAARVAAETHADLAILMSDVNGIYDRPPELENARIIHTFNPRDAQNIEFGAKSDVGTGGMESKVKSALWALENGSSVVVCNGMRYNTIRKVMKGDKIGSFFTRAEPDVVPVEILAKNARNGSRSLQALSPSERAQIITSIADALIRRSDEILTANKLDLVKAEKAGLTGPMYSRLVINHSKILALADGLKQIADSSYNNVGRVVRRTKLSDTMDLVQKTVPIGVLLVIFESRPDCLPQVAALAIASSNGLLMKGGKEATHTNDLLMAIVKEGLGAYGCAESISLVSTREGISDLLKMDQYIDLIIPRGSSDLVRSIKERSKMIPVLGHSEGICHVYIDNTADKDMAFRIILDSKTDYPAACNAMETLLIHEDLIKTGFFHDLCAVLKEAGVQIFSGPALSKLLTFGPPAAETLKHEYSDMACTIEVVKNVNAAIEHIHKFGSGHTDVVVTEDDAVAQHFLDSVDSACAFVNASSRMSDGYRMGLGAEVGISTGRIHARGPVGVDGLLTTKWILHGNGDTAADYAEGRKKFVHQSLPVDDIFAEQEKGTA